MRIARTNSRPPADLGEAAVTLHTLRMNSEADVLAAIVQARHNMMPAARRMGMNVACFDLEYHRLAWCVLDLSPAMNSQDRLTHIYKMMRATFTNDIAYRQCMGLFDLWPDESSRREYVVGTVENLKIQATRLRELITAARDAERLLKLATSKIDAAIGGAIDHKLNRGPGGYSGGDKHDTRRTLTDARVVKRSA